MNNAQFIFIFLGLIAVFVFSILLRDTFSFDVRFFRFFPLPWIVQKDPEPLHKKALEKLSQQEKLDADFQENLDQKMKNSGLNILFFSDLHAETLPLSSRRLVKRISQLDADYLLFGGDLSSGPSGIEKGLQIIRKIRKAKGDAWIIGVRGNHDAYLKQERAQAAGLILLENQSVFIRDNEGQVWQIVGTCDLRSGFFDLAKALQSAHPLSPLPFQDVPRERRIFLSHNPDAVLENLAQSCAYFLSGHFHGGQIRLPFRLEMRNLRQDQLCKRHKIYDSVFIYKNILGFISRGIGCVLLPFRFRACAELTMIHFDDAFPAKKS